MDTGKQHWIKACYALALSVTAVAASAATATTGNAAKNTDTSQVASTTPAASSTDTQQQIIAATNVVQKLEADPQLKTLLGKAKGVFLIPTYARGGWGLGIRGGEGVMLVNNNGEWSSPVFYNYGGVSVGAQAGAEVGSMAMLLMNDKAVNEFSKENNFSLTAGAGLTIVNYTGKAQAAAGNGDVIVWSDTKGAFANATVGITDIHFDDGDNHEFYHAQVSAKDIMSGKVGGARAKSLKQALATPAGSPMKSSGGSGMTGSSAASSDTSSGDTSASNGAAPSK